MVRYLILALIGVVLYQLVRYVQRSRKAQTALPPTDKGPLLQCAGCGAWFPGESAHKVDGQVYCRSECVGKKPG